MKKILLVIGIALAFVGNGSVMAESVEDFVKKAFPTEVGSDLCDVRADFIPEGTILSLEQIRLWALCGTTGLGNLKKRVLAGKIPSRYSLIRAIADAKEEALTAADRIGNYPDDTSAWSRDFSTSMMIVHSIEEMVLLHNLLLYRGGSDVMNVPAEQFTDELLAFGWSVVPCKVFIAKPGEVARSEVISHALCENKLLYDLLVMIKKGRMPKMDWLTDELDKAKKEAFEIAASLGSYDEYTETWLSDYNRRMALVRCIEVIDALYRCILFVSANS